MFSCDYVECSNKNSCSKDHCREHYREYHMEDLIKRNEPRVEEFLAKRVSHVKAHWWRCTKCLQRVIVSRNGYKCAKCEQSCEPKRVAMRKKISVERDDDKGYTAEGSASKCFQCHDSKRIPATIWLPCPTC